MTERVIRLLGMPGDDAQRALAVVLDAGPNAQLHGATALGWYGFRGYDLRELHVSRSRGATSRRSTRLGHLHHLRDLRHHDTTVARGVPTETPLRAIWSEATRFSPPPLFEIGVQRIGRLLDDAHVRGLVRWSALHELVDDIHRQGRAGSLVMRELARTRQPGTSPTESRNEDQFEELLRAANEALPRRQVPVGGREAIGRCDFADDHRPVVFEINSLRHHTSPSDRAADQERYTRLRDEGFSVGVIWEDDLWSQSEEVVSVVRHVRRTTDRGTAVVVHSAGCPWPVDSIGTTVHIARPALPTRG